MTAFLEGICPDGNFLFNPCQKQGFPIFVAKSVKVELIEQVPSSLSIQVGQGKLILVKKFYVI
jgi:hypothetical protein